MLNTIDGFVCIKGYTQYSTKVSISISLLIWITLGILIHQCHVKHGNVLRLSKSGFDCPSDNNSLYLLCTFIDLCDLSISKESLYREFLGVSVTA